MSLMPRPKSVTYATLMLWGMPLACAGCTAMIVDEIRIRLNIAVLKFLEYFIIISISEID